MKNKIKVVLLCVICVILLVALYDLISFAKFKTGRFILYYPTNVISINATIEYKKDIVQLEQNIIKVIREHWTKNAELVLQRGIFRGEDIINKEGIFEYEFEIKNRDFFGPRNMVCTLIFDTSKNIIENFTVSSILEKDTNNLISSSKYISFDVIDQLLDKENITPSKDSYLRIRMTSGGFQIIFIQHFMENTHFLEQSSLVEWDMDIHSGQIRKVSDYRKG